MPNGGGLEHGTSAVLARPIHGRKAVPKYRWEAVLELCGPKYSSSTVLEPLSQKRFQYGTSTVLEPLLRLRLQVRYFNGFNGT